MFLISFDSKQSMRLEFILLLFMQLKNVLRSSKGVVKFKKLIHHLVQQLSLEWVFLLYWISNVLWLLRFYSSSNCSSPIHCESKNYSNQIVGFPLFQLWFSFESHVHLCFLSRLGIAVKVNGENQQNYCSNQC